MPPRENQDELKPEDKNKIMHISLEISKGSYLMGSDVGGDRILAYVQGNNFSISLNI